MAERIAATKASRMRFTSSGGKVKVRFWARERPLRRGMNAMEMEVPRIMSKERLWMFILRIM